jgi:VIT1/CCC1 family predicted Fe2+/Mn2+ transporter
MSSFLAFAAGAVIPLVPFVVLSGASALLVSLALTALVLMAVGAFTARMTHRTIVFGALRALVIGALATGVTYVVGRIIGVAVN